jgi:hypothetical protein
MAGRSAQTIALWLIAIMLTAAFAIEHIRPAVLLALNRDAYLAASHACHEARTYAMEADAVATELGGQKAEALRRSAGVAVMDCHGHSLLRAQLLAAGVVEQTLDALDLEARLQTAAGPPYLTSASGA